MEIKIAHNWVVDKQNAQKIQNDLRKYINLKNSVEKIKIVAGVDCSYNENNEIKAVYVSCNYETLSVIETIWVKDRVKFPYIPGFLAFREGPAIVELLKKVKYIPDVVILNGHGIAHPYKMGLATHIGIIFDIVTIGCARKMLYGTYSEPPLFPLSSTFIKNEDGDIIGHVLRNYNNGLLFISPGHKIDLKNSLIVIIKLLKKEYALPYPLYLAHAKSSL